MTVVIVHHISNFFVNVIFRILIREQINEIMNKMTKRFYKETNQE